MEVNPINQMEIINAEDGSKKALKNTTQPPIDEERKLENSKNNLILHLIFQNDMENLKQMGVFTANLNFNEEFKDVVLDQKISPLCLACYQGKLELTKLLLTNKTIDINFETYDQHYTALIIACLTGNYEIVNLLLECGAEVNKTSRINLTPFVACFARLQEQQTLYSYENKQVCFKMARLLLDFGADINWIMDKIRG